MAPFLPPGGCVPPRLWFSGAISPGDSSLGLAQRRRNQAATSASTGRSPLVVSASHDSDSTPARPSSVFPLWPWKIGWCRRTSKCAGSDAASAEKAPSFQQIVSAVYQQRHLAKTKGPKRMIRLYGLPFTYR